jgi:hypothetical protein
MYKCHLTFNTRIDPRQLKLSTHLITQGRYMVVIYRCIGSAYEINTCRIADKSKCKYSYCILITNFEINYTFPNTVGKLASHVPITSRLHIHY